MYALNLSEDNRILSACVVLPIGYIDEEGNPVNEEDKGAIPVYDIVDGKYNGMPVVETLPEGDISNYKYINNEYIYDPLPEPEPIEPEPTQLDVLEAQVTYTAMMTDTLLEV